MSASKKPTYLYDAPRKCQHNQVVLLPRRPDFHERRHEGLWFCVGEQGGLKPKLLEAMSERPSVGGCMMQRTRVGVLVHADAQRNLAARFYDRLELGKFQRLDQQAAFANWRLEEGSVGALRQLAQHALAHVVCGKLGRTVRRSLRRKTDNPVNSLETEGRC
eukprot:TRINITY_DN4371_c0_g1_i3.p2 TRINITY_DN4371_c0_g1~~TRINITY_DN4371_c0_g1_i3.p2  ORF type:complete len:162 (-),score=7.69 TRINITY_DN4371_c0_g1_i3:269-754(-)